VFFILDKSTVNSDLEHVISLQLKNNGKVILLWKLINWENAPWIFWYTYWRALICLHPFNIVHTLLSCSPTHLFKDSHVKPCAKQCVWLCTKQPKISRLKPGLYNVYRHIINYYRKINSQQDHYLQVNGKLIFKKLITVVCDVWWNKSRAFYRRISELVNCLVGLTLYSNLTLV
jgi:hypothetical protein